MFVELIFTSFLMSAAPVNADDLAPTPEHAVFRTADANLEHITSPLVQEVADLGCPRYRDRRRRYSRRCYRRHSERYHERPPHRYDRYERYSDKHGYDEDSERYAKPSRDAHIDDETAYRAAPDDILTDRYGRPYSRRDRRYDERYTRPRRERKFDRRRDFDRADPRPLRDERPGYEYREPGFEERDRSLSDDETRFDPYRESRRPDDRSRPSDLYSPSSYHDRGYKKKDTEPMKTTPSRAQVVVYAAGLTV